MSREITKIFLHVLYLFPVSSVKVEKEYHESKLHLKSSHRFGDRSLEKEEKKYFSRGFSEDEQRGNKKKCDHKVKQKIKMYKTALMIHRTILSM